MNYVPNKYVPRESVFIFLVITACIFSGSISGIAAAASPNWGFAVDGYPVSSEKIRYIERETGLKAEIINFYLQWPAPDTLIPLKTDIFPSSTIDAISSLGAMPCITWEPMYIRDGKEVTISYSQVLSGQYDEYIASFADSVREWKKPLIIRFAHEMNIDRYHWGTDRERFGPESPAIYKNMFRYVVDIFRRKGARNVFFAFCPNSESVPPPEDGTSWNIPAFYYPGDDYVDILGLDGYNWGLTQKKDIHGWTSSWKTFEEIFSKPVNEMRSLSAGASGKPFIIFETASASQGGDKTRWIIDAVISARRLGIDGIVWFQCNKEIDWRMNDGSTRDYLSVFDPTQKTRR